jgi:hypothetical protein
MAFPNNPSNGDTFVRYGRTYQYDSAMLMWKVPKSGILLGELADIDITTNPPIVGDALRWSGSKFEPETINTVTVYQTDLPLTGNTVGNMAYITDLSSLYIFNGGGWFNVAIINTNPTITTGPDGSYTFELDGTPIVITLVANDPEGLPITWSYAVTTGSLGTTATVAQTDNAFTITPGTNIADEGIFGITFTASDGVNLATAASTFTLIFSAPAWRDTTLSIGTSSTSGLTNKSFEDKSSNIFAVNPIGNAYQSPFNPHFEEWSTYIANGSRLGVPTTTGLSFGTGDFTVEAWVYKETLIGTVIDARNGIGASPWAVYFESGGQPALYTGVSYVSTIAVALNTWTHVAVTRSSGTLRIFVNGVQGFSGTVSTNLDRSAGASIGARVDLLAVSRYTGYISDLRVVKDTALYTSNFTPPRESLTAISGTTLLVCQSNRHIDNSVDNLTITPVNAVQVKAISPYTNNSYTTQLGSGSGYFDGVSNYLQVPSSTAFNFTSTGYTMEGWVYMTSTVANQMFFASDIRVGNVPYWYFGTGTTKFRLSWGNAVSADTGFTYATNTWYHIAISMNSSGTGSVYINGTSVLTTSGKSIGNDTATLFNLGGQLGGDLFKGYMSDVRVVNNGTVYTSNFTPPTEPLTAIAGTVLLTQFDNAGIYDKTAQTELTLYGTSQTSTAVTKYADTSILLDGNSDYIDIARPTDFGTGDFTIEVWAKAITISDGRSLLMTSTTPGGAGTFMIRMYYATSWELKFNNTTYQFTMAAHPNSGDGWDHFAISRSSGVTKAFINGVLAISVADVSNYADTTIRIGEYANYYWHGYIENLQTLKGIAKYTSNFTVPTKEQGLRYQATS